MKKTSQKKKISGMDNPQYTFKFLRQFMESKVNNGIVSFTNVASARQQVKIQIASFLGELLRINLNPTNAQIKDLISEIKTLRHELGVKIDKSTPQFLAAVRFMLEEESTSYRHLLESIYGVVENGIKACIESETFTDFILVATGNVPEILEFKTYKEINKYLEKRKDLFRFSSHIGPVSENEFTSRFFGVLKDKNGIVLNRNSLNNFEQRHKQFLNHIKLNT